MNDKLSIDALGDDYRNWLTQLKRRVERARQRAVVAVNHELVTLYWQIGRDILDRQQQQGWGARVIARLATDLKAAFPDMKGFSPRNLKYMRALAQAWPEPEIVQQPVAQLPWSHIVTLLDSMTAIIASGMHKSRSNMAGRAVSSSCKLKPARMPEPGKPSQTSKRD